MPLKRGAETGGTGLSPTKVVKEWWGIIVVVGGMIGGFVWLETKYAKIAALETEASSLRAEIVELECQLSYTIDERRLLIEQRRIDELKDVLESELNALDEIERTTVRAANIRDDIDNADREVFEMNAALQCLRRAIRRCPDGERYDPATCD